MSFHGEIVFSITDDRHIDVDFGSRFQPAKMVQKGDVIALGRRAPKYRWIYKAEYGDEEQFLVRLDQITDQLCEKRDYVNQLIESYEKVEIDIYIRSDLAQIGFSLPDGLLKRLALSGCALNFHILSFGMAAEEVTEGG